jgi:hypothetical protein
MCPTEVRVIAWIQDILEPVWREKQGEGSERLRQSQACLLAAGDQLESSRDGENMIEDHEKPIRDNMQNDQLPTE